MEQLTKTRFQNVVVNKRLRIGDDNFDPNEPSLLYVAGDMKVTGSMGFNSNVNIDNDLVINGSLTVKGTSTIIQSENHIIHDNTIVLNAGLQNLDIDFQRETGIIIQRPLKNGFPQEPFKIVYKDVDYTDIEENGIDHNDILDIGISGDLHRVATINDYPTNRGIPMWNDASNILDTETNIYVEKQSIGGASTDTSQNLHVRNGTIYNTGRDGQHYDIDVLYQPPPKFGNDGIELTTTYFRVKWRMDHVIKRLAFLNIDVPFIDKIGIDIKRVNPPTDWIEATREHPKDTLYYDFIFNAEYGDIRIASDTSYNVRVYGINFVQQTTDNYLLFENLSLNNAGVPNEPTSIRFGTPTLNSLKLIFTTPSDNDSFEEGNQAFPAIKEYEYVYKRLEENSDRNVVHPEEEYTRVYTTLSEDKVLSKEISFNITENVFPGTAYQLIRLRAKNEVASEASGYGLDGIGNNIIETKTLNPETNEYFVSVTPDGSKPVENKVNFRLPNDDKLYDLTYYKSGEFSVVEEISSFFVNNGRIGEKARQLTNLVKIELSYTNLNITNSSPLTIRYNGYPDADTIDGETKIEGDNQYFQFTDVSCVDAKKEELKEEYSGFGLVGTYKIGIKTQPPANNNIHTLKINVTNYGGNNALSDISASSENTKNFDLWEHNFVIDSLTGNATISNNTISASDIDITVLYCHGVPSIRTMTTTITYALNNYVGNVLPADLIVSKIGASTNINGITDTDITSSSNVQPLSITKTFTNCSFNTNTNTNLIDTNTIPNVSVLTPINFSGEGTPVPTNMTDTTKFFVDVKSYTASSNTINQLNSIANEVYIFKGSDVPTLYNHTSPILNNQLIYINGVFTNDQSFYKDFSSGYKISGPNYANFKTTGTNVSGTSYKWVIKKFTSTYTDGQFKELIVTINDTTYNVNDTNIPIKVFAMQREVNGNVNTPWLDMMEQFNADMNSLNEENAGNRVEFNDTYYAVFKGKINTTFDFYVRIGLVAGGVSYSITNIEFENINL